jgi:tRNA threonylcarbamoyladenosine biosynthesis protein TsaE
MSGITKKYKLNQTAEIASLIISKLEGYSLVLFEGEVGAGKTTLIKEICSKLGVKQSSSSPTFSVINEYEGRDGTIYHIDLYRLNSLDEALEIGIDEYIYSGNLCLIEWPQILDDLIFDEAAINVIIEHEDDGRSILIY